MLGHSGLEDLPHISPPAWVSLVQLEYLNLNRKEIVIHQVLSITLLFEIKTSCETNYAKQVNLNQNCFYKTYMVAKKIQVKNPLRYLVWNLQVRSVQKIPSHQVWRFQKVQ